MAEFPKPDGGGRMVSAAKGALNRGRLAGFARGLFGRMPFRAAGWVVTRGAFSLQEEKRRAGLSSAMGSFSGRVPIARYITARTSRSEERRVGKECRSRW